MNAKRFLAPAAVLAVTVVSGGWFLQRGVAQDQNVYLQVRLFEEVVDHIANQYVEEIDRDELYRSAIDGLIDELGDPNTSLIRASDYEDFRIRTEGDYGGVGLEIIEQDAFVTVVTPIPGGPAIRSGVRAGDRFVVIAGEDAIGKGSEWAVEQLRGEPGSSVDVEVRRIGVDEPISFTLRRERIQIRAVPFATLLEGGVGYVPLQIFQQTALGEVRAAIDSLREAGATSLVLDLRGNPGGLLEQGIGVSDLFLDRGDAVVETRGRDENLQESFQASDPAVYEGLPVAVLVDETSASASEIVAGALQDHDRALVVGNRSYGKGSVQTVFRLSGGNAFRLTTAKWYTPVGRSISMQLEDQRRRALGENGTLTLAGQLTERPELEELPTYQSVGGRTLRGGGGITPDVVVLPDTLTTNEQRAVRGLFREAGAFNLTLFNYAARYIQEHPALRPGFTLDDRALEGFYAALRERDVPVDAETLEQAERFVRYQLGREIALQAFGEAGQFRQVVAQDDQLRRAVELLREAGSTDALFRIAGSSAAGSAGASAAPGAGTVAPAPGGR